MWRETLQRTRNWAAQRRKSFGHNNNNKRFRSRKLYYPELWQGRWLVCRVHGWPSTFVVAAATASGWKWKERVLKAFLINSVHWKQLKSGPAEQFMASPLGRTLADESKSLLEDLLNYFSGECNKVCYLTICSNTFHRPCIQHRGATIEEWSPRKNVLVIPGFQIPLLLSVALWTRVWNQPKNEIHFFAFARERRIN